MKRKRLLLAGSLIGAELLLALVFLMTGDSDWDAMTERVDQLRREAKIRRETRSVLRGEPVPGNAWVEYNLAMDDGLPWAIEDENEIEFLLIGYASADPAKVRKLVSEHRVALDHLRLGAQRTDGQYPFNWEKTDEPIRSVWGGRKLKYLAAAQARFWMENGRVQDAANLLLDLTVYARDIETNGPLLTMQAGYNVHLTAFDELRNVILSGNLTKSGLEEVGRQLEIVDRDFPTFTSTFSNHTLQDGMQLIETVEAGSRNREWRNLVGNDWRFLLSPQQSAVDAFALHDAHLKRYLKAEQMEFASAKKEMETLFAEKQASSNVLVRRENYNLASLFSSHRYQLARLRLLRAGVRLLTTGEVPTLADPFGKNLLSKRNGSKTVIWSIGPDGKNQNGVGSWNNTNEITLEVSAF